MQVLRYLRLISGLMLYGFAGALMVRSDLGMSPWNVFHQGVAEVTGISFGMVVNLTGATLLLLWIPLRQRLGPGTILNVLIIGSAADLSLSLLPATHGLTMRWLLLILGVVLTGFASGVYIGAGLQPGPRDGLMTAIVRHTGSSVRVARASIELTVLAIGALLGGRIGWGTIAYAITIGPIAQFFLHHLGWEPHGRQTVSKRLDESSTSGAIIAPANAATRLATIVRGPKGAD